MKYKLNKLTYHDGCEEYANINLINFINSNLVEKNDKIWNYRDNIVIVQRKQLLYYWSQIYNKLNLINHKYFIVPIEGYGIYKSINIFSQNNNNVSQRIYNTIIKLLDELMVKLLIDNNTINMYGIGGEFYVYFKILRLKYIMANYLGKHIIYNGYSNNNDILNAAKQNNCCSNYNLINYNDFNFNMDRNGITIINLSKINKNIIQNLRSKYVISITCKDNGTYSDYKYIVMKKIIIIDNVNISLFKIC